MAPWLVRLNCEDGSARRNTVYESRINRDLRGQEIQYSLSLTSSTRRALTSSSLLPTFGEMVTGLCQIWLDRVMLDEKRMVAEQAQNERYDKKLAV